MSFWSSLLSLFRKVLSHFSPAMLLITISLELLAAGSSLYNSCLLLVTTEQLHMSSWRLSTSLMGMLVEVIEKEKRTLVILVSRKKTAMTLQLFLGHLAWSPLIRPKDNSCTCRKHNNEIMKLKVCLVLWVLHRSVKLILKNR